jgi:hypothetical protein
MLTMKNSAVLTATAIMAVCLLSFGTTRAEEAERSSVLLIRSPNLTERAKGKSSVVQERRQRIADLLAVVNMPVASSGDFFSSESSTRNIAIYLLGHMRSKEAIPTLLAWLSPREGQGVGLFQGGHLTPAASALVEIGLPAAHQALQELKNEGMSHRGAQCLMIAVTVMGPDGVKRELEVAIRVETNAEKKEKLHACMGQLKDVSSFLDKL